MTLRLQFSLRSLFIATAVFAVVCGLVIPKARRVVHQNAVHASVEGLRGDVVYDYMLDESLPIPKRVPYGPRWLRAVLGEKFFSNIVMLQLPGTKATDDHLAQFSEIGTLRRLDLSQTRITDEGLKNLKGLPLTELFLYDTKVSDKGLQYLRSMPLTDLGLQHTEVSDEGMQYLRSMPLRALYLSHTRVSDQGLKDIGTLSRLEALDLDGTAVTDEGIEHLRDLHHLKYVWIEDTALTTVGFGTLRNIAPDCFVKANPLPKFTFPRPEWICPEKVNDAGDE